MDDLSNLFFNLEFLLIGVLVIPVLGAIACALAGLIGTDAARRTASWFASIHLIITVALVFLAGAILKDRVNWGGQSSSSGRFAPIAVIGDVGVTSDSTTQGMGHATSWSLLSLDVISPVAGTPSADIEFFVGIDGLNLGLILLASLMAFLAVMVSWRSITEKAGGYYAWLFALQACATGAFVAFDIILFYVFFELTLIPAFFLIGRWGVGGARRDAARRFFLYTMLGGLISLIGIIGVVASNPTPVNPFSKDPKSAVPVYNPIVVDAANGEARLPAAGPLTFSIPRLIGNHTTWSVSATSWVNHHERRVNQPGLSPAQQQAANLDLEEAKKAKDNHHRTQFWLFIALMAGFVVKIPLVPFHTWLPAAYGEAPIAVTMYLSAVLAKLGTYGILRIILPLAPEAAIEYGLPIFGLLGAIGIVYAGFCAYAQRDLKLLFAYSSISHLGFLVLGLFAYTPEAIVGAVMHMINHGLTVGALFALLGFLHDRYRTLDIQQYSGLWNRYPRYTFFVMLLALAAIGLPGLNNFVSEMLMMAGLFDERNLKNFGYGYAVAAAIGIFLAAWYTLSAIRKVFFGPLREPALADGVAHDLTGRELVTFGVLASCCVILGLIPQPMIDVVRSDAERLTSLGDSARYTIDPESAFRTVELRKQEPEAEPEAAPGGQPGQRVQGPVIRVPGVPVPSPEPPPLPKKP